MVFFEVGKVVLATTNEVEPATPHGPPHNAIGVLRPKIASNDSIETIDAFGYPQIPTKHQNQQNYELEDRLTDDMLEHFLGDYVLVARMGWAIQEGFDGRLGGQS